MEKLDFSVFVSRNVPVSGVNLLKSRGITVSQHESDEVVPRSKLLDAVKQCDGVFCLLTDKIDESLVEAAGKGSASLGI